MNKNVCICMIMAATALGHELTADEQKMLVSYLHD